MLIEKKKLNDLKPAPYNPRTSTDKQEGNLKASLEKFGVVEPIIFNKQTGFIVGGHFRVRELKKLGFKEVECVIVDLSEEDEKELNIRLNANTGSWEWDMLANEWEADDLEKWGLDVPGFIEEPEAEEDDFDVPDGGIETDIVLGDLFEIGEHRLLCGDSTDSDAVAKLMDGQKADMVFTDPPYSITTQGGGVLQKHFTKTAERIKDIVDFKPQEWLQTLPLYFNGNMNTFIFCNKDLIPDYLNFAKENNYNFNILVWCKKQVVPFTGGHHYSDIEYIIYLSKKPIFNNGLKGVEYRKYFVLDNEKSKDHPTIKPLEIISNEIQIASNKNGIVAECFTGSGTTMVAAHQLKRKCYGMELDPKYCQVIVDRMLKLDPNLVIKRNGEVYLKSDENQTNNGVSA
jgi:DNA modification methylase